MIVGDYKGADIDGKERRDQPNSVVNPLPPVLVALT